jgi:hypothetical protein
MRPALLARSARIGYVEAWDEQRRLADLVRAGDCPTIIWLLEHDPVYTYGRHGTRDDLFIYVKRQVGGLQPGRSYDVAMQLRLATGAPSGCVGVGGAPGESVWVHAGATVSEPRTVLQGAEDYRVNIDRGNQAVGGGQGVVMGTIANGNPDCQQRRFATKLLSTHAPHLVAADGEGRVWLHAGIDSGFEAYSEIYLQSFSVVFTPR